MVGLPNGPTHWIGGPQDKFYKSIYPVISHPNPYFATRLTLIDFTQQITFRSKMLCK